MGGREGGREHARGRGRARPTRGGVGQGGARVRLGSARGSRGCGAGSGHARAERVRQAREGGAAAWAPPRERPHCLPGVRGGAQEVAASPRWRGFPEHPLAWEGHPEGGLGALAAPSLADAGLHGLPGSHESLQAAAARAWEVGATKRGSQGGLSPLQGPR